MNKCVLYNFGAFCIGDCVCVSVTMVNSEVKSQINVYIAVTRCVCVCACVCVCVFTFILFSAVPYHHLYSAMYTVQFTCNYCTTHLHNII